MPDTWGRILLKRRDAQFAKERNEKAPVLYDDRLENDGRNDEIKEWLGILMASGSSLGGGRPKANILDDNNELLIAKFPSKNDALNKGAWEFLSYQLDIRARIKMAPSRIEKIAGNNHTFLQKD